MDHINRALDALFSISREFVIGTREGQITFMNPAAIAELGNYVGQDATKLLPQHILEMEEETYVCSTQIQKKNYSLASSMMVEMRLFLVNLDELQAEVISEMNLLLASMRATLSCIRLTIEDLQRGHNFVDMSEDEIRSFNILYHGYYCLVRLAVNTADLVDFQHGIYNYKYTKLDLVALCRDLISTVSLFTEKRGINLIFGCRLTELESVVDRQLIEKLILHLLVNSLKHAKSGGSIRVSLAHQGESAVISVDDDGEGIRPERLSEVFSSSVNSPLDPKTGLGIGLRICRHIANAHSGSLIMEGRHSDGMAVRARIALCNSETSMFKSAEVNYRCDGMEIVLTQLSPWLRSSDYERKLID